MPNRIRPSGVIAGQRFTKLVVTVPPATQKVSDNCTCQCDCGTVKNFKVHNLLGGMSTSCGCSKQKSRCDYQGQRFGRLTVVGQSFRQHNRRHWPCKCECGKLTSVATSHLVTGHTKSCGCLEDESRGKSRISHGQSRGGYISTQYHLFLKAKERSKRKNVPFNLTLDDIEVPTHCPLLGTLLVRNIGMVGHDSYTIDELIPGIGYIPGNVQTISYRANTIKSDATIEELEKLVNNLKLQRERLSDRASKKTMQQSELVEIKLQEAS